MTSNNMEPKNVLRERVKNDIEADAVTIDREGEDTRISLFYHEPEKESKLVRTPMGLAIAIKEHDMDKLIARVMDKIQRKTTPSATDIKKEDGYCIIELFYLDGSSW